MRLTSLENRQNTRFPDLYGIGHQLCFSLHDSMTNLLVTGRQSEAFYTTFEFQNEEEQRRFEEASDVFTWLDETQRYEDRISLLTTLVFPAVLGDMLHCIYETLEASRKGKLTISYMLLRKPLQESLFVLESIVADPDGFAVSMNTDPTRLHSQGSGGIGIHQKRIAAVLGKIDPLSMFDASYLTKLRYDKTAADGFDGICNKSIHLFTTSKAIKTDRLNINMIFSSYDDTITQWRYLYSRLPYVLSYMRRLVEYVCAKIVETSPLYLEEIDRRIAAQVLLWWDSVDRDHAGEELRRFVLKTRDWLFEKCQTCGFRHPSRDHLATMADTGAFPEESLQSIAERSAYFAQLASDPSTYNAQYEPVPQR